MGVEPYVNNVAAAQAYPGDTIKWKITYRVLGDPLTESYKVIHQLANPDRPGTIWGSGVGKTVKGDGSVYEVWIGPVTMPNETIHYYHTLWDENWNLLDESAHGSIAVLAAAPTLPPEEPVYEAAGEIELQREIYAEVPPNQYVVVQCRVFVTGTPGFRGKYVAILMDADIPGAAGQINGTDFTETIPDTGRFEKTLKIPFTMPAYGEKHLKVGFWGPGEVFYVETPLFTIAAVEGVPPEELPEEAKGDYIFPEYCEQYGLCIKKKHVGILATILGGAVAIKVSLSILKGRKD